jgi:HD-GYP domain-containing protein (c-di-GMP phosphodiesterase class II)
VRILAKHGGLPKQLLRTVATHHERWNGSGYPVGLTGTETPIFGRVLGLVDCYEAMTSPRPYRHALPPHDAIGELYEDRGSLFQPELVEQFIQACGIFPTGSLVELNTGEVAVVIGLNGTRRLRPKLMLLLDGGKRNLDEFISIDLSVERPELFIRQGLPPGAYGVSTDDLFL